MKMCLREQVLQIEMPRNVKAVIDSIKPFVANIWQSFLPVECIASLTYYQRWLSTVFAVPILCAAVAVLWYGGERLWCKDSKQPSKSKASASAVQRLRGNLSLVVFVLYPSVCNQIFGTFNCRKLSADLELMVSDFDISCSTPIHKTFQLLAAVMVGLWCVGIPLGAAAVLVSKARGAAAADPDVATKLANEWSIEEHEALDAVRSIELGREWGFLLEAFRPGCFAWCVPECCRVS